MKLEDFRKFRAANRKLSMVTCYDAWSARIVEKSAIDCVLVGDSVAMVVHGYPSTVHATVEMMAIHIAAVARELKTKYLVGDLPFLSYRRGVRDSLDAVDRLVKAGAASVKLEGVWGHEDSIEAIVKSGVPVMGHIGLTPQSIHGLGGFKVQGRDAGAAQDLLAQAKRLEELGCFAVVLECVPGDLGARITESLAIPTIGIGAGPATSGQVLVLQDLLGLSGEFRPKFLKRYWNGEAGMLEALAHFQRETAAGEFPAPEHAYS